MFEWANRVLTACLVVHPPRKPTGPALVRADDDGYYFVKANSESRPAGANEAAAWCAATAVGLSTPTPALVDLGHFPNILRGLGAVAGETLVFGSCLHGDGVGTYDCLPRGCFGWIENLRETVQWAAFDVWIANIDPIQPVFSRAMAKRRQARSLRALKISHARCFEGFQIGSFTQYSGREVDRYQRGAGTFDPSETVSAIRSLSVGQLRAALDYAPRPLVNDSYRERLLEGLLVRQAQLPELIECSYAESPYADNLA